MASRVPFPRLELIVAMEANWGIGLKGALPWHIPKEFKYYISISKKREDPNKPNVAIFGRKTWESLCALKLEPMSKCINIIISRNMDPSEVAKYEDVHVSRSLEDSISLLQTSDFKDKIGRVWVHGGADIYREAMKSPHFYRLYLTKISKEYDCDVFYPKFDENKLELVEDPDALQGIQEDKGIQFQVFVYQTKGMDPAGEEGFVPNESFVTALLELGYDRDDIVKALFASQNRSVEAAVDWLLENTESDSDDSDLDFEPHKMVLVVNASLKMGAGKIAAQAGHATLGLYRELVDQGKHHGALASWEQHSLERKIALKGENEEQLLNLQTAATKAGLPSYLVRDAGLTQIAKGSRTVLAIFGSDENVNKVTGELKLL